LERVVEQLTVRRESFHPAGFFERDADQLLRKTLDWKRLNPDRALGSKAREVELQVSEGASKENVALYDVFASGGMGAALAEAISGTKPSGSKAALVHRPNPFSGRTLRVAELRTLSQAPTNRPEKPRLLEQTTDRPGPSMDETPYAFATAEKTESKQDESQKLAEQGNKVVNKPSEVPASRESERVAEAVPVPITMVPESKETAEPKLDSEKPKAARRGGRPGTLLLLGLAAGLALSAGFSWKWISQRSFAERSDLGQLEQNIGTVRTVHEQTRDEVEQMKARAAALESKTAQVDALERKLAEEQENVREMQAGMQKMGRDVSSLRHGLRMTQRAVDAKVWQIDQSSAEGKSTTVPITDSEGPYHPKMPIPAPSRPLHPK